MTSIALPATRSWIGLVWLPGLIALQSIPGTGALRTLFLLAGIVHLIVLARSGRTPLWPLGRSEAIWLAVLTAWLIVQSALLSLAPGSSLAMLGGEWTKLLLMVALGIGVVAYAERENAHAWPVVGLFFGFFIHVASTLGYQAWTWLRSGTPAFGDSFLGNYGYASPFVTGALAFLLAEAVTRLRGRRWLPFANGALVAMAVATLAAQAMLIAKASLVVAVILFLVAAAAVATAPNLRHWRTLFLLGGIAAVAASLAVSNRWHGAFEAIALAANTPPTDFRSLGGASSDPAAPPVKTDGSFYDRAVWAKIGLDGIGRHPLGLGYGSDAFGRYVAEQGGPKGAVSSHSGWIDFALANGIPGLALLLALFMALMRRGWRAFRAGNPAGLAALLVTLNFFARSAIDGNLAGSRLTGFAFVAAALWALAAQPGAERDDRHAD